jgi:hypothetical protein
MDLEGYTEKGWKSDLEGTSWAVWGVDFLGGMNLRTANEGVNS